MIKTKYKYYLAVYDFMVLSISFGLSFLVVANNDALKFSTSDSIFPAILLFAALSLLVIYAFERKNLYKINVILKRKLHITALLQSILIASAVTFTIFFLSFSDSLTDLSLVILVFIFSSSLLFTFTRIEIYKRLIITKRNFYFRKNCLIVGAGKTGMQIAKSLLDENPLGINIIGFLDDRIAAGVEIYKGKKVIGKIENIKSLSGVYYLDEVIIAINKISYDRLLEIIDDFSEINAGVKISSKQLDILHRKFGKEKYGNISVLDVTHSAKSVLLITMKRWIDVVGAIGGLILLSPLLVIIVFIIKITSPGPILYKQTRIGYNGRPFTFYKFRSMYVIKGEDEERKEKMLDFMNGGLSESKETKVVNDRRVTWIGKFIRRTSLDEIPQLINVIKGDMSLVGPRPCLPYEYECYKEWQKRRLNVIPGCTGVWQISGRSAVSFNDSVLLDLYYINNLSLWFDLRIILKTLPVMFFSKGGK